MQSPIVPPIQIFEPPRVEADSQATTRSPDTGPPTSEDIRSTGRDIGCAAMLRESPASKPILAILFTVTVAVASVLYLVYRTIATYDRMTQDVGLVPARLFLALVLDALILLGWFAMRTAALPEIEECR